MWARLKAFVEKHPYAVAAGVFVIGVIIIYLYNSGGSSSGAATGTDASALAAQAAVDQAQIQANNNLAVAQLSANTQLGLANTAAGVQNTQTNAALTLGEEQIGGQLAENTNNNATTVSLANIAAQEAGNQAATQEYLADVQSNLQINAVQNATGEQEQANEIAQNENLALVNLVGSRTA